MTDGRCRSRRTLARGEFGVAQRSLLALPRDTSGELVVALACDVRFRRCLAAACSHREKTGVQL